MFLPALVKLGTPEQQAKWVPKALNMSIIGTYAQTGKKEILIPGLVLFCD